MDITERLARYNEIKSKTALSTPDTSPSIHCYCRVSTKQQRDHGHSIDAQKAEIEKYITDNDIKGIVRWYVDSAVSGKDMKNREQFNNMREDLHKGDTLISYSLSRLGRNTKEILIFSDELKEKGIILVLLKDKIDTSTATGAAMFSMLAVMSTLERDLAIERSKTVIDNRMKEGYTVGKPPFGFKTDKETKKLIPDDNEQHVITLIAGWIQDDLRIKDAEITRRLQSRMDMGEIKIRNSKRVYQTYVNKIIKRNNLRELVAGINT